MLKPTWRIPSLRCDKTKWWRSDWVVFQDGSLFDMQVENIFLPKGRRSLEEECTYNIAPHCPPTKRFPLKGLALFHRDTHTASFIIIWETRTKMKKKKYLESPRTKAIRWHSGASSQFEIGVYVAQSANDLTPTQWEHNDCCYTDWQRCSVKTPYLRDHFFQQALSVSPAAITFSWASNPHDSLAMHFD